MTARRSLFDISQERILVLDGAMGTMIQDYRLEEEDFRGARFESHPDPLKGFNDLLCLTQPHIIREIHEKYLAAGADIIETNTFNANRVSMEDYGLSSLVFELNRRAAEVARDAVNAYATTDRPKFVAGVLGPTNKTATISPRVEEPGYRDITFQALVEDYTEATKGLLAGGVDILMVETVFDTLNCKAALF
ncbi:MAG: homocysteine S-methyltransferase family protein, partial [Bradymonadia bacterium]